MTIMLDGIGKLPDAKASHGRDAESRKNDGNAHLAKGEMEAAAYCYREALVIAPDYAEAHNNLGFVLLQQQRFAEARRHLEQAICLKPALDNAHFNLAVLGGALIERREYAEAAACLEAAAKARPDPVVLNNLGTVLNTQGLFDDALAAFRSALALAPYSAETHANLGLAFRQTGRLEEALESTRKARDLNPALAGTWLNLGLVLQELERLDEAADCYLELLSSDSDRLAAAKYNLGVLNLSRGRLAEGWRDYEFRFHGDEAVARTEFPYAMWSGQNIEGKRLLIWGEQGVGDEMMFASMFEEVVARAGHCVIECTHKLVPLFARSFPAAQVIPCTIPPHSATQQPFDYQCAAGSLARWLRPTLESFPHHTGFLVPDARRLAYWRARLDALGPGLKVGFCWRSGLRSGPRHLQYSNLDQWGPIFSVPGVHFINLQYDRCEAELDAARERFGVLLHAFSEVDLFNDLDEAAALTGALDLVISAQTAAGVLAGALDVPTWILTCGIPWISLGTDRIPWFPSQRLYRRRWDRPWDETVAAVAQDLTTEVLSC